MLDLLARLVDKSLVVVVPNAEGVAGLTRYHFLETLHQYALDRLDEAGEEARVRERHLAHFIALGEATFHAAWAARTMRRRVCWARRLHQPEMLNYADKLLAAFYQPTFTPQPPDL